MSGSNAAPVAESRIRTLDLVLAFVVAVLIVRVYLMTIYPGLFGMGDAAKFSFVGKVLGTPHSPGYPLYVMVSHLFSYVPWGTLAFRMNALSALLGAVAVFFLYFGARTLGARPAVAASVALACGLGRAFWGEALYAKGYTLAAALVCGGILLLLRWSQTGRRSHFHGAIAIFSIAIGNHLIVISLVPALVLHALMTSARTALAPRTLLLTAMLITAGVSQYSLIVIRTWQQAPYLEAQASSLTELVDVVTARRYAEQIGAFSAGDVVRSRIPAVASLVRRELTPVGLALVVLGLMVLARRRARDAVLCLGGALGVMALTANMSANEDEGFLLSAFLLLWLLAAVGLEAIWSWQWPGTDGSRTTRPRRLMPALALLVAVFVPAAQVVGNYDANDHHRRTFEMQYFDALFAMLPDKAVLVRDRYPTNMMVTYKLLGEEAARGRDIVVASPVPDEVRALRRQGYRVFVFDEGRLELARFGYEATPVTLYGRPFPLHLEQIRDDVIVVVAATPAAAAGLMSNPGGWARIGVPESYAFRKPGAPYGVIGVSGAGQPALEANGIRDINLVVPGGGQIGQTTVRAPQEIRLHADEGTAAIWIDGQERARTRAGAVVALVSPNGQVEILALEPGQDFRVPIEMAFLPLFEITSAGECMSIGNQGWQDVSTVAADGPLILRIDNYRPHLARTVLYVVGDRPSMPSLVHISGTGVATLAARSFRVGLAADDTVLDRWLSEDGLAAMDSGAAGSYVTRVETTVDDGGDHNAVLINLDMKPTRAWIQARVDLDNPRRATVCAASSVP